MLHALVISLLRGEIVDRTFRLSVSDHVTPFQMSERRGTACYVPLASSGDLIERK
jgi:hypothetical protein